MKSPATSRLSCAVAVLALATVAPRLEAQQPNPDNYEFQIRTSQATYTPDDPVVATAGLTTRAADVQGWSFGLAHDAKVLTLETATIDNTDADALIVNGFQQTSIVKGGFFQAVILSLGAEPVVVPVSDFFSIAQATYSIEPGACDGVAGLTSRLDYSDELGQPGRPVDTVVTVAGLSVTPSVIEGTDVVIDCEIVKPPKGLSVSFRDGNCDLPGDQQATLDLDVLVANSNGSAVAIQGWSYGVTFDPSDLTFVMGEPGADAQALKGGAGPDFTSYDANQSEDGTLEGVTVGVVIDLGPPGTNVLQVAPSESRHVDTIRIRSTALVPEGMDRSTTVAFTEALGGGDKRDPIEVILVVDDMTVEPDFSSTKEVNLLGVSPPDLPRFIRSDANDDGRSDFADGVWIISDIFYSGPPSVCPAAADANSDGLRDLGDALFIFEYWLQAAASSGGPLAPPPAAPFPGCGTHPQVSFAECPSSSCPE